MENQPGFEKNNPLTQMLHEVKRINRERGAPAGKTSGVPIIPVSNVRVSSAAMLEPPKPLPETEQRRLDELARAEGIDIPVDEEENQYPAVLAPDFTRLPTEDISRQTAREFLQERPRFIDFKKIQGVDLIRNVAFVDSFEIALPEEKAYQIKNDIIDLAIDFVTKQLAEALTALNESKAKDMQKMPETSSDKPVLSETKEETVETKPVQKVRRKYKRRVGTKKSGEKTALPT